MTGGSPGLASMRARVIHKHPQLGVYVNITHVGAEKVSSQGFDRIWVVTWVRLSGSKAKCGGVCGLGGGLHQAGRGVY